MHTRATASQPRAASRSMTRPCGGRGQPGRRPPRRCAGPVGQGPLLVVRVPCARCCPGTRGSPHRRRRGAARFRTGWRGSRCSPPSRRNPSWQKARKQSEAPSALCARMPTCFMPAPARPPSSCRVSVPRRWRRGITVTDGAATGSHVRQPAPAGRSPRSWRLGSCPASPGRSTRGCSSARTEGTHPSARGPAGGRRMQRQGRRGRSGSRRHPGATMTRQREQRRSPADRPGSSGQPR